MTTPATVGVVIDGSGVSAVPVLDCTLPESRLGALQPGHVRTVADLAATTAAESRIGAGHEAARCLVAALGPGVNADFAVEGAVVDIAGGSLGDAGHVPAYPEGPEWPSAAGAVGAGLLARDTAT